MHMKVWSCCYWSHWHGWHETMREVTRRTKMATDRSWEKNDKRTNEELGAEWLTR